MKTIFIPIFQGVEAKNILRTDIYKELVSRGDIRLVLFIKNKERLSYYNKQFEKDNIVYEVFEGFKVSILERIFSFLKFLMLRTETTKMRKKMVLQETNNYLNYWLGTLFNIIFSAKPIRKIVRWLDFVLARDSNFKKYFNKYNPDMVFLAHLFDDVEVSMLREAKKRGVRSTGFINSWDKLTARCNLRLLPDKLIVFNEIVKKEALKYADIKEKDIFISGIPQYDIYVNNKPSNREEFCKSIGLNPSQKIIVFAPIGRFFSDSDWEMIDLLRSLKKESLLSPDVELLIRFQPNDFIEEEELKKRPDLLFEIPGIRFSSKRGVDWDMDFSELQHLLDTLYHSSLLICYASSLSVEAAILDKPVININFEVKEKRLMSESPTFFYKTTHYQKALQSGGIRLVNNKEEFLKWINLYLKEPSRDKGGRERLVKEQCWRLDGQAGKRIAQTIIDYLFF